MPSLPDPDNVTVLAIMRADHPTHTPTRSTASIERHGDRTVIVADDGTTFDFDAKEIGLATCAEPYPLRSLVA